jgi:hypothetical protein
MQSTSQATSADCTVASMVAAAAHVMAPRAAWRTMHASGRVARSGTTA